MRTWVVVILAGLGLAGSLAPATASQAFDRLAYNKLAGPVPADVLRVVDGDTIEVRAHIWLGQAVETLVRLYGLDTPELKGKCPAERTAARRAKALLEEKLADRQVVLRDIRFEKYAGRVMSRVETTDGQDMSHAMIADGAGRSYNGHRRGSWCVG
jgi:endonuclease YncB( thermonuclease family)